MRALSLWCQQCSLKNHLTFGQGGFKSVPKDQTSAIAFSSVAVRLFRARTLGQVQVMISFYGYEI